MIIPLSVLLKTAFVGCPHISTFNKSFKFKKSNDQLADGVMKDSMRNGIKILNSEPLYCCHVISHGGHNEVVVKRL